MVWSIEQIVAFQLAGTRIDRAGRRVEAVLFEGTSSDGRIDAVVLKVDETLTLGHDFTLFAAGELVQVVFHIQVVGVGHANDWTARVWIRDDVLDDLKAVGGARVGK